MGECSLEFINDNVKTCLRVFLPIRSIFNSSSHTSLSSTSSGSSLQRSCHTHAHDPKELLSHPIPLQGPSIFHYLTRGDYNLQES